MFDNPLGNRYEVIDLATGKRVKEAFVLCPKHDKIARDALRVYALSVKNDALADRILEYLERLREGDKSVRGKKAGRGHRRRLH